MKRLLTGSMLLVALVLLATFGAAPAADAGSDEVTFKNRSTRTQHVLVAFGADAACSEMPSRQHLSLEPRESSTLDVGGLKACFCTSPAGKIGDCGDAWQKVKPGRTVQIK